MNNNSRINYFVISMDVINILWGLVGQILSITLKVPESNADAIRNCMRDFGMGTSMMAFIFLGMSYLKLFRLGFYLVHFVYHRQVLGWWEARSRKDVIHSNRGE